MNDSPSDQRQPFRDAVRVLFILTEGAARLNEPDPSGHVACFRGEARLHAFDFWIRNPDYLADELLNLFEQTRLERYRTLAAQILGQEEPSIRRLPMLRYRFGAYEPIDDTLAVLSCRGLVRVVSQRDANRVKETDFLVTEAAYALADSIAQDFPVLSWYSDRAKLVAEVAGDRGGNALKQHQYKQAEYAATEMGTAIPSILGRVERRLAALEGI